MLCRTGVFCSIFAFVILIPSVSETAVRWQRPTSPDAELPLRQSEDIAETYELQPGAHVEVSVITGPVEIETTNSSRAEVRIVRPGAKRETADCYTVAISHSPSRLIVRNSQEESDECSNARPRQEVKLRLPRNVDLKLSAISGSVTVGEIDGTLRMNAITGTVDVAQALVYSEISGISGVLLVKVPRLSERGLRISGVSGRIELRLARDLNADLRGSGIDGNVDAVTSNVNVQKVGSSGFQGKAGFGGSMISVSGVSGSVTFRGSE